MKRTVEGLDGKGFPEIHRDPWEAIRANVLKVFEGVDLQTSGKTKVGLITYNVLRTERGMCAIASIGALTIARIDEGKDMWGCDAEGRTSYTLFADMGDNYYRRVMERDGKLHGSSAGGAKMQPSYSRDYESMKEAESEMLEPL